MISANTLFCRDEVPSGNGVGRSTLCRRCRTPPARSLQPKAAFGSSWRWRGSAVQGAAGLPGGPADGPVAVAVVDGQLRAARVGDLDDVADVESVEEPLGVLGVHVETAVGDVVPALHADRLQVLVQVFAVVGDPDV